MVGAGSGPPAAPVPTAPRPPRRARWRAAFALPAILLALLGVAGLVPTIRSSPPPPPAREPIRYPSGPPLADRLVIILAPQLNERDLAQLRAALTPDAPTVGTAFAVARPSFMSFDDISLVLLAGNGPSAASPPAPADQPPDTLVRSVLAQGQRATLIGPAEWRALFGMVEPSASASPRASSAPKSVELALGAATAALAARDAPLVIVQPRELAARDLRDEPGGQRAALGRLGAQLGPRDATLLVGGGGAIGEPLHLILLGAGARSGPPRTVALNDVAATCAALLGVPYPAEGRGRIAWALLEADERQKAQATAGLARQRAWLATGAVPFGVPYSEPLRALLGQLAVADTEIAAGSYAFAYQLASSNLDEADRQLVALAGVTPLPLPRRAAWGLAVPLAAVALLALAVPTLARAWGALAAVLVGAGMALTVWLGFVAVLRQVIVPNLATVVALTAAHVACGGAMAAWGARRWMRLRPALAVDLLVLLAALPAALCAARYGPPWRLRLEEAAPLFLWRSALLAPVGLLVAGYGALGGWERWGSQIGEGVARGGDLSTGG